MKMPSSVTGPERAGGTDPGRRTTGRRADGGDDFGSALSAELSRPGRDDNAASDAPKAADARAADARAAEAKADARAADTRAAGKVAADRAAADRAAAHRAADRSALQR